MHVVPVWVVPRPQSLKLGMISDLTTCPPTALVGHDSAPSTASPTSATMDRPSWFRNLSGYFVYTLLVATLGPLLFGFHLVGLGLALHQASC